MFYALAGIWNPTQYNLALHEKQGKKMRAKQTPRQSLFMIEP